MGVRGEIFSTKVQLQNRTYFFNVKENRLGDIYLNVVESKNRETGGFDRQSIVLFADDLREFLKGFDDSLKVMEKAAAEKKKALPRKPRTEEEGERDFKKRPRSDSADPHTAGKKKYGRKTEKESYPKAEKEHKPRDRKPQPKTVRAVRRDDDKPML